jgi:Astacin (Peptidase family M12A)
MPTSRLAAFIVAFVALTPLGWSTPSPAHAHDTRGAATQELQSASPVIAAARAAVPAADLNTRSVLNNLSLWPVPRKLTVCFLGGTPALRKRVTDAMRRAWPILELTEGRLDFDATTFERTPDCSNPITNAENLRIAFVKGDGHWSYVGVESLQHVPSLNLDGFTENEPAQAEFDRIVGHETGHALGLEHEHQSPAAPDCGWNFKYLSTAYVWKSDQQMTENFVKLTDFLQGNRHAYVFSSYDIASLMHYFFEPDAFLTGKNSPCYVLSQSYTPSDQDGNAIRVAYGRTAVRTQSVSKGAIPTIFNMFSDQKYIQLQYLLSLKQSLLVE